MPKISRQVAALLAGAAMFAVGSITFWAIDLLEIWARARMLWPVLLGFFFLSILLSMRKLLLETQAALEASRFSVEVDWRKSSHAIRFGHIGKGEKHYDLETTLRLRFNNGDSIPHLVKNIELLLLQRRWIWKPRQVGRSYYASRIFPGPTAGAERLDRFGPGIEVQANRASDFMWLRFWTKLPPGNSSIVRCTARVEFEMLGKNKKVILMPVDCPDG